MDSCLNATQVIDLPFQDSNTTVGATIDFDQQSECGIATSARGVWYALLGRGTVTTIGIVSVTFDTEVAVFSGSCDSLTCVANNGYEIGWGSSVLFLAEANVQYFIHVTGTDNTVTWKDNDAFDIVGTYNITIMEYERYGMDLCSGATQIAGLPYVDSNTTIGAFQDFGNTSNATTCGIASSARGVWYSLVGRGTVTAVNVEAVFDSEISVFSGGCDALGCVVNSGYEVGFGSSVVFLGEEGVQYFIHVTGTDNALLWKDNDAFDVTGSFNISVVEYDNYEMDSCSGAKEISTVPYLDSNTTIGAFHDFDDTSGIVCGIASSARGVWYSLVGQGNTTTVIVISSFDSEIAIFSGSCEELNCVSNSGSQEGMGSSLDFVGEVDVQYFIHVTGTDNMVSWKTNDAFDVVGSFTISVSMG